MVRELLAMAAAFGFLIYASNRLKLWHGAVLLLTGVIMSLCAGHSASRIIGHFTSVLTSLSTMKTISVILQIGVLSCLMKHYGILDRLVGAFQKIFSSEKTVMMLLPAAFGILSVPGGAQLSSPFVYQLGEELHMPVSKRAAVNISFRHIAYMLLPTSSSMIVLSSLAPGVSVYQLIGLNVAYVFLIQLAAYWFCLKDFPCPVRSKKLQRAQGIKELLKYLFPIYIVIVLNGIFGVPMYLSVFASLMLLLLIWARHDVRNYWNIFIRSVSLKVFVMMLGVFFMQNTIKDLSAIMNGFTELFARNSGFSSLFIIAAAALFFAFTTGLSYVSLGVVMPLILGLHLSSPEELLYCFALFAWAYNGYYFSPLHLCQLLTMQQMECASPKLYREYAPLAFIGVFSVFILFYMYRFLFI